MPVRQPLPRTVSLFHDETVDSFLRRLAAANHLPADQLLPLLEIRRTKKTPINTLLEPLAAAAGVTRTALELALPEFLDTDAPDKPGTIGRPRATLRRAIQRPACRRCTQAAGITLPVTCWTTHDRNVCLRHRLWIGDGITNPDEQVDISRIPDTLRAQRHHRNLITRHGRRWVRSAYPEARKIYFTWLQSSADPFDILGTARHLLTDGAGKAPSHDLTLAMVFHPQVVALTGLLAGREWERRAVATGHVTWLIKQITLRGILLGYVPKERQDPLIQWVEQHFSLHKFAAFHRSRRVYDAFFPRETIPPSRRHEEVSAETRWSPFHPYYRC
ncbi:TniQ family protein [Streptomyces sp. CC219B]|uniref:TniQ family protein n=1 Tax=Streptomyces sp. CC219B TaxID=3044574 RepID=UPI0024A98239|nr:TniQ family protein [Streptomyces sp. CC219B]